ncbi:hypothetical protein CLAFUW4_10873 [Fulvia fulva]|uniref:Uncharacterized protein n=1 Tax=Passalora fulva TaxID=5499 RepID=A0A9Q8PBS3_PASFU|nr:uncharacterized protein CLAFUR5_09915 [Fulvia fulva]KAK4619826.1 hypothetical protein CLAFUR4_10878 [Fulvia fulva]KAK4620592.1 hypothetical protein CLAFUR0_10885 [Fulvia fulva]UJO19566.1 hypothetical protein CLAFUR5_09915 [Fulvia fulva]WPV16904.1 hypothetical protein CLAFUW4_10873 [Fulvia fulva]WPV31813.1 hypothetical protein CLAFUW7_10871 [Fulvia fulva]
MRSFIVASLALSASIASAMPQLQARQQAYDHQGNAAVDAQQNYRPQGYSDNTYPGNTQVDADDNVRPNGQTYSGYQYTSGSGGGAGYGYDHRDDDIDAFTCPGLQAVPQCCELNALGVVSASCKNPTNTPHDKDSFNEDCAQDGKTAQCCLLPLLAGVSVACNDI